MLKIKNNADIGSSIDINAVQTIRRFALGTLGIIGFVVLLFTDSAWQNTAGRGMDETIESIGLVLMAIAIVGRTWCSLYIGGRKKQIIVEEGPYSICRNPLYVFSFIGAAGAGAQFGAISTAILVCAITIVVFAIVTRKEEQFLRDKFGRAYEAYCGRVPRFIPNFRLWRPVPTLEIQTSLVTRTFLDACLFLAAYPVAEAIEWLQDAHYLPVYFLLP
ncbi:sodium:proton antiporter [Labrys miyagiensis]|uniref:Sodium:proton antiporter n=1 Tax=Labrys miyagiensis TaxID=346912 RepID=A0ABQ6CF93_9HYPH|nr:isoprenylcysteine carboxylmethyltransferase family protein [Labrys miyagiensis]GLS19037.1 sodium:proton antiporter [Labrys miyagiensis]